MATLIKVDRNGTKYYEGLIECDRCSGKGIYYIGVHNGQPLPSWVDGGVCFKCGGRGKVECKWKEYTQEYLDKLAARRKAREDKWQQEHAAEIAKKEEEKRKREEEQRLRKEEEAQKLAEKKALSRYYGIVGDKIDLAVQVEKLAWFEVASFKGYGTDRMYVYTFILSTGETLVWKTTKGLDLEQGMQVQIKGTIKEHQEYKEMKQTVLTRCTVIMDR